MAHSTSSEEYLPLYGNPSSQTTRTSYMSSCFSFIAGFLILFYMYRLLIAYESNPNPISLTCQTPKYDYDILAIQWTPSFCAHKKCIKATEDFKIHGLWPSWKNGSKDNKGPQNCCEAWTFSDTVLEPILPLLSTNWPNLIPNQEKDNLWNHEWTKHGTCSTLTRSGNGMLNYFNTTLALFNQYPLQSWLTEAGIKPTDIDSKYAYTLDQIHEAIETKINATISIQCTNYHKEIKLLDTIYLCFKSPNMTITSCPPDHCFSAKKIVLPSYSSIVESSP